ncbi:MULTISPECIES: DUF6732 family protein [unclassified Roseitalea]|uniref:DUF6732 family protein n=1 Tax=unclassified Roseitalea TaxID=2639107 RepID=UPI00273F0E54|nr:MULTISPECIES: DUF6732 family protein [unclassified Roseitalea]
MTSVRLASLSAIVSLAAVPAFAHPGHVAEQAGHQHYLTYGAAGLAVLIGVGALVIARRRAARRDR